MKEYKYTIKEYEESDYEVLEDMSIEEIIHVLERIKRGYLPQDYMYYNGTEEDYENIKLHIAMSKAIKILKEKGGLE